MKEIVMPTMDFKCYHTNIVIVTEKPRDGKGNMQMDVSFVECEDCKALLPIGRITKRERIVDIIK